MNTYKYINNPFTNYKVNIKSKLGKQILFNYLNFIDNTRKTKKIYGGAAKVPDPKPHPNDTNIDFFKELLLFHSTANEEHASNYMLERDMSHDFGNWDGTNFTKNHPLSISDQSNYLRSPKESDHIFHYMNKHKYSVSLYYVDSSIDYYGPSTLPDIKRNCIFNGLNDCDILKHDEYRENIKLPDDLIQQHGIKRFVYLDSGSGHKFHKDNTTWPNLFDPATKKNNIADLPPFGSDYENIPNNYLTASDLAQRNNYINHKWQQILIFIWYTKVGSNGNQSKLTTFDQLKNLWPDTIDHAYSPSTPWKYHLGSSLYSNTNYLCFYIAINILRCLNITLQNRDGKLVASAGFETSKSQIQIDYEFFKNPILDNLGVGTSTKLVDLPISQAEACNVFVSTSDYNSKSRQAAKKSKKISDLTNVIRKRILEILKLISSNIPVFQTQYHKIVIMYVGLLFKYLGDTSFILAQLYDSQIRSTVKSYLRSLDNFLGMRSIMYNTPVLGECKLSSEIYDNFKFTLDPKLGKNLDDYTFFYNVVTVINVNDILIKLNNLLLKQEEFESRLTEEITNYNTKINALRYQVNTAYPNPAKHATDEIKPNDTLMKEFNKIKEKYLELNKIDYIFKFINKNGPEKDSYPPQNILIESEVTDDDDISHLKQIVEKFIFHIIRLYDPRISNHMHIIRIGNNYTIVNNNQNTNNINLILNQGNLAILKEIQKLYNNVNDYLHFFESLSKFPRFTTLNNKLKTIFKDNKFKRLNNDPKVNIDKKVAGIRSIGDQSEILQLIPFNELNVKEPFSIIDFLRNIQNVFELTSLQNNRGWMSYEKFQPVFNDLKDNFTKFMTAYELDIQTSTTQEGGMYHLRSDTDLINMLDRLINLLKDNYDYNFNITTTNIIIYLLLYIRNNEDMHLDLITTGIFPRHILGKYKNKILSCRNPKMTWISKMNRWNKGYGCDTTCGRKDINSYQYYNMIDFWILLFNLEIPQPLKSDPTPEITPHISLINKCFKLYFITYCKENYGLRSLKDPLAMYNIFFTAITTFLSHIKSIHNEYGSDPDAINIENYYNFTQDNYTIISSCFIDPIFTENKIIHDLLHKGYILNIFLDINEEESETTPDEVEEDSTSDTPQNELAIQTLHNAETIELSQTEKLNQFIVPEDGDC